MRSSSTSGCWSREDCCKEQDWDWVHRNCQWSCRRHVAGICPDWEATKGLLQTTGQCIDQNEKCLKTMRSSSTSGCWSKEDCCKEQDWDWVNRNCQWSCRKHVAGICPQWEATKGLLQTSGVECDKRDVVNVNCLQDIKTTLQCNRKSECCQKAFDLQDSWTKANCPFFCRKWGLCKD